jgi:hypothetical protein
MRNFSELSLMEFTQALKFVDQVFNGPAEDLRHFLDRMNTDCRLAEELILAMAELTGKRLTSSFNKAFNHCKVVLALWVLLYEPEILAQLRNR